MQLDTMLKFGSLAFSVAQDDNIRELFSMVHKGARRRGLIGVAPSQPAQSAGQSQSKKPAEHPVPFAPAEQSSAPSAAPPWNGGADLGKLLNGENAKKLLGVAGRLAKC